MNPDTVVLLPSADGRYDSMMVRGLVQLVAEHRVANVYTHIGCSNIQLAREECVHHFIHKTTHEWALWIDSDIGFTMDDYAILWEDDAAEAACCEYRKKDQENRVAAPWGFGFCRTSRRLLEEMAALSLEDGRPMLPRFRMKGEEYVQYFPQGVLGDYDWRGEDHGFWTVAKLTGARIAYERRTRLVHVGTARYLYDESIQLAAEEVERNIDSLAEPPTAVGI